MRLQLRRGTLAILVSLAPIIGIPVAGLGQTAPAPREERVEDLPAGAGRDEAFGMCTACHAYRLVANQGMTREKWDETLVWMTQRHNLPAIEGADRQLLLDYLAFAHPPKKTPAAGGFRNPFAPQ